MRINEYTVIYGEKVLLVPYERHHVPKYHAWMQARELQRLTASEPLTLDEEYEMQKHWREDNDKCTFIILDLKNYQRHQGGLKDKEIDTMIGDVNLFFNDGESRDIAEVEIMIADAASRGKGFGKEALNSMMRYGMETLHVNKFVAKIGYGNQPSQGMFKKLGFEEVSRSDVFEEVTMELYLTDEDKMMILENTPVYRLDVQGQ
ncbi:hypothetical protein LOTGIDRAFT_195719 [Lottia gigantea]|uniref:N-acetyltransferase 9-like protein n=1 Tax=Lottia gigantea TaxID=225164 RepID=V3ZTA1_LOTGI|nr:hypothetical protein LOTGIDRAFT_195719 [Lottia gigantea]ESO85790.1 hypothetical protein LOTGIDRAFT_195719 [Lottia gigantea]